MYKLKLTKEELNSLATVANWYESAWILYDHMVSEDLWLDDTKELTYYIDEWVMWEYMEWISSDWSFSDPDDCPFTYPPCIGGTLRDKLANLYEEIV